MQYVFWVIAYNTTFVTGYLVVDMFFFPRPTRKRSKRALSEHLVAEGSTYFHDNSPDRKSPALFEAINLNGLLLFLLVSHLYFPLHSAY